MHILHSVIMGSGSDCRERRLCFLDAQRRHDILEEAVQTAGTMETETPLRYLQSNTQKVAAEIAAIKIGWRDWIGNFFSNSTLMDSKVQESILRAAESHIQQESDLAIGKIEGLFRRGKRRLYLASKARIAEQIREDVHSYLQRKTRDSLQREGKFSRCDEILRQGTNPLPLSSPTSQKKLFDSLQRLASEFRKSSTDMSPAVAEDWKDATQTEQIVKQRLLRLGGIDVSTLDEDLADNAQGGTRLQSLLRSAPQLKDQKELRNGLLKTLKELQRGNARNYRLKNFMERDANIGTVTQRLQYIQQDPNILARKMRLSLHDSFPIDTFVVHRGDGFVVLCEPYNEDYYILDTTSGEVTYRDSKRVLHDFTLKESSFSVSNR